MTEQQQIDYEGQGFLVVEDALGADELETISAAFDAASSVDALEDLPNRDDCFLHLAEHPILFPLVHGIMSDDLALRSLGGLSLTPSNAANGWHRPVASMLGVHHPASNMYVQLFISLDDCCADSGCIAVVPASHRFKADLPFPDINSIEEMPHHLPLRLRAGSAVILHGNLWRARLHHRAAATLRLLEYAYVHCWMRQALPDLSPQTRDAIAATGNLASLFGIQSDRRYWDGELTGYPSSIGLPKRAYSPLSGVGYGTQPNTRMGNRS
jgi:hypothetical protein